MCIVSLVALAQQRVSETQAEVMQMQVKELIANYFASLNSIGDKELAFSDKELILVNTLRSFENKSTLVFNDLDPSKQESASIRAEVYLGNILTRYAKGLSIEVSDINISKIFFDKGLNRNFLKAEVIRSMKGIHINQSIARSDTIDIYIAFIEAASTGKIGRPLIYGIEPHKDNLASFNGVQDPGKIEAEKKDLNKNINSEQTAPVASGKLLAFGMDPAGKKYKAGSFMTIRWNGADGRLIKGDLYRGNELVTTIFSQKDNKTQYRWKIPSGLRASKNYTLKLSSLGDESITAVSGQFSIQKQRRYRKWIYAGAGALAATGVYLLINNSAGANEELPGFPDPP
jgi:hypothetical protein